MAASAQYLAAAGGNISYATSLFSIMNRDGGDDADDANITGGGARNLFTVQGKSMETISP